MKILIYLISYVRVETLYSPREPLRAPIPLPLMVVLGCSGPSAYCGDYLAHTRTHTCAHTWTHAHKLLFKRTESFLSFSPLTKLLSEVVYSLCILTSASASKRTNGLMYFASSKSYPYLFKSKMSSIARCSISLCAVKKKQSYLPDSRELKLCPDFKDV